MLGRLYDKVDGALGQPIDMGEVFGVEEAASMILAEILDRADTLYALFVFGSADEMDKNEIARAILVFHRDCEEARARAERLGLMFEPGSYTESIGERSIETAEKKVEVHPYANARWYERIKRQTQRHPVPEWAKVKPTPEAKEEPPSPETGA